MAQRDTKVSELCLAVRGKSRARSRARELRSLARHEEEVNAWSFTTTRNTPSGRKPLAPFGLRAAQVHLLRCPSLPMLGHGLRRFALHLHPRRPQRGSWDFHHDEMDSSFRLRRHLKCQSQSF